MSHRRGGAVPKVGHTIRFELWTVRSTFTVSASSQTIRPASTGSTGKCSATSGVKSAAPGR